MARRRAKDVEIFNFSFLDILACTVGALTFILVLLMVTSLNEVTSGEDVQELLDQIAQAREELQQLATRRAELTTEIAGLEQRQSELQQQIAADQAREQQATARVAEARKRQQLAEQTSQDAKQVIGETKAQIAQLQPQRQQLAGEFGRLQAEVSSLRVTVEKLSTETEELEQGVLNREQLAQRRANLEKKNQEYEQQLANLQDELQSENDAAEDLVEEATNAEAAQPELLANVEALRERDASIKQEVETLTAELEADNANRDSSLAANRGIWVLFAGMLALLALLCAWLLWKLAVLKAQAARLRRIQRDLDASMRDLQQAEDRLRELQQQQQSAPRTPEEAVEGLQDRLTELQTQTESDREAADDARRGLPDVRQRIKQAQREVRELNKEAEEKRQEALANSTPVNFRIPLLRETQKESHILECYEQKVARVWKAKDVDEHYYRIDENMTQLLSVQLGSPTLMLERRNAGEPVSQLSSGYSKLGGMLGDIRGSSEFLFAFVRPTGFEAYRQLREAAWNKDLDVGWVPFDEDAPMAFGGGDGGNSAGIQ
jgi:cell division protein FtsB